MSPHYGTSQIAQKRTMVFVDGENLVIRFQELVNAGGRPLNGIRHIEGVFVWHPGILLAFQDRDIRRIAYYTSATGSEEDIAKIRSEIAATDFALVDTSGHVRSSGRIVPRLFKKAKRSHKTRAVDINITIDVLNHAMQNDVDEICLISGDSDFVPLIETVMRRGLTVRVLALSSGLNPALTVEPDTFKEIDHCLLHK